MLPSGINVLDQPAFTHPGTAKQSDRSPVFRSQLLNEAPRRSNKGESRILQEGGSF
jgi:hypothetical protein